MEMHRRYDNAVTENCFSTGTSEVMYYRVNQEGEAS